MALMQRAAKKARTGPMLNPLAMMMNPMAAMAQMASNPMMNPMNMGMNMPGMMGGGSVLAEADEDHQADLDDLASSSGGAASSAGAEPAPVVAAPPAVPNEDDEMCHQRLGDALITRSATYLKNIGRNRLSDLVERLHPTLDATYTAECSRNGLLCLIWVFTRVKPNVKISDLRKLACISVVFV